MRFMRFMGFNGLGTDMNFEHRISNIEGRSIFYFIHYSTFDIHYSFLLSSFLLSSVFCLLSSVFCLLSSVFCLLSSVFFFTSHVPCPFTSFYFLSRPFSRLTSHVLAPGSWFLALKIKT